MGFRRVCHVSLLLGKRGFYFQSSGAQGEVQIRSPVEREKGGWDLGWLEVAGPRSACTAGGHSSPDSRCVRALCRRSLSSLLAAVCLAGLRVRVQDKCLLVPVGRDSCQDLPGRVLHRRSHETNITWPLRMGPWRANPQPSNP